MLLLILHFHQIVLIQDAALDLVISMETVVVIVYLRRLLADALPAGLLPFVFPFMFCSETKRATAFDFYDHVSVMWTKLFLGCNSFATFHCFIPHYPKPLRGQNLWNSMPFLLLLCDIVGINVPYFDHYLCRAPP